MLRIIACSGQKLANYNKSIFWKCAGYFFLKDLFIFIRSLKAFLLNFILTLQYTNSLQYSHGGVQRLHFIFCTSVTCGFSWDGIEVEGPAYVSSWTSKDPQQGHTENRKMNLQAFNVIHVYSYSLCIVFLPHCQLNKSYNKIEVASSFVHRSTSYNKQNIGKCTIFG